VKHSGREHFTLNTIEVEDGLVELAFLLTLPAAVILITVIGAVRLIRAKASGRPRPSSASIGLDMLDTVLRPGSEHRIIEVEKQRVIRDDQGNEEKP
jgi:hypothetical protein